VNAVEMAAAIQKPSPAAVGLVLTVLRRQREHDSGFDARVRTLARLEAAQAALFDYLAETERLAYGRVLGEEPAAAPQQIDRLEKALHKAFKLSGLDFKYADPRGVLERVRATLAPLGIEITARRNAAKDAAREVMVGLATMEGD
jgi:hypothetical protein